MKQETETLQACGRGGRTVTRLVNQIIDIREFTHYAVYPWLVMAANPHLSAPDISEFLGGPFPGAFRPASWINKRRWMCGAHAAPGNQPNRDGRDPLAFELLASNRHLSLRDMTRLLKENGIPRGREWVRVNRMRE
jgi:hypothetical protein